MGAQRQDQKSSSGNPLKHLGQEGFRLGDLWGHLG